MIDQMLQSIWHPNLIIITVYEIRYIVAAFNSKVEICSMLNANLIKYPRILPLCHFIKQHT